MAAEAEVDWERNGDLAAEQPLDVFVVVMASCRLRRRGRGEIGRREEVAEEEREGEVVFVVQEGDFGEGFRETAVCGTNDETARCQFGGRGGMRKGDIQSWTYTLAAIPAVDSCSRLEV